MRRLRPILHVLAYWLAFLLLSGGAHVAALLLFLAGAPAPDARDARRRLDEPVYVRVELPPMPDTPGPAIPEAPPGPEADAPKPPVELDGQIVEVARPPEEHRPDDADYLAQYDTTVPKETMAPRFEINPEVVAPIPSEESRSEEEATEVADVGFEEASEGSPSRRQGFDPLRDGVLGSLPRLSDPRDAPWSPSRVAGASRPSTASDGASLAGAPQNDLLREDLGTGTYLNTKELLFADYLLKIRRLVNFYWQQNLDNAPSSLRIARPEYTTVVQVVLSGDGSVEQIDVTDSSGIAYLDDAVTRAYRVAGPFPNPPAALISDDGRVHLPTMRWTVRSSTASNRPVAVDPRSDVQFPGLYQGPNPGR